MIIGNTAECNRKSEVAPRSGPKIKRTSWDSTLGLNTPNFLSEACSLIQIRLPYHTRYIAGLVSGYLGPGTKDWNVGSIFPGQCLLDLDLGGCNVVRPSRVARLWRWAMKIMPVRLRREGFR